MRPHYLRFRSSGIAQYPDHIDIILGANIPETDCKTERKTDGTFTIKNPGKPLGARHKATQAALALIKGEGETLTRKATEMALSGDTVALTLCLERLAPTRKDAPVRFELPPMEGAANAAAAMGAILASVASVDLTPSEATSLAGLVDVYQKTLETTELETSAKGAGGAQAMKGLYRRLRHQNL